MRRDYYIWLLRSDRPVIIYGPRAPTFPPPSFTALIALGETAVPAVARAVENEKQDGAYAQKLCEILTGLAGGAHGYALPAIEIFARRFPDRFQRNYSFRVVSSDPVDGQPAPPFGVPWPAEYQYDPEQLVSKAGSNALPLLTPYFSEPTESYMRGIALSAAASIEFYSPPDLIAKLAAYPQDRLIAAEWAKQRGYTAFVPLLLLWNEIPENDYHGDVAKALHVLARPEHGPLLLQAYKAGDLRLWSLPYLLGSLQVPGAEELFFEELKNRAPNPEFFPKDVVDSLGLLRSTRAVPLLADLLKTTPVKQRRDVRECAAKALVRIGTPEALSAYLQAYPDRQKRYPDPDRRPETGTIGRFAAAEALPILIPEARLGINAALDTLGAIRDPKAVPQLIVLAQDENQFVRSGAVIALAHLRSPDAADVLLRALNSDEVAARASSAVALGIMRHEQAIP